MKKLLRGIVDFRKNTRLSCKDTFAQLALGQEPDTLFIACSDSRVVPNLFASSDPGDLFVVRNVGNLVPACGDEDHSASDESEAAAIEFALSSLPVTDIVICGHSECGAMEALVHGRKLVEPSNLRSWLRHGEKSLEQLDSGRNLGTPRQEPHNLLSQLNVLAQIEHLKTYPLVLKRLNEGTLRLHGWWFDIQEADVYEYDSSEDKFHLIDEEYAGVLLGRLDS
ncbi:MAG TPA: carbonic anhydrase [Bdellovibrionales bacterium]|nr:MAG: carbonic anhydrase [Bdellovibrionales bacterium GWB1_52_6]OFZ04974.1 MAG: carbonic anhydrase [Bdellovibrionales bacterium GWA1_52_35]OFZ42569.1 MAG: carbonic anhydrase [Bdellovibrionales bacterium GWC1_52_8]HAR41179.1 carbonic anhydrase [Bdellovibrionales bacterium]HCM41204.1 carbonic anhydrase [Bdellovibrionales bacterium]